MIFSPDFAIFKGDTEDERYVNGYFIFNVSKLISFMPSGMDKGFVTQKTVSVDSCFEYVNMSAMEEEHIKAACVSACGLNFIRQDITVRLDGVLICLRILSYSLPLSTSDIGIFRIRRFRSRLMKK